MFAPHHQYQRHMCQLLGGDILNVACKEDPAHLGTDFGAVNCDVNDYDPQEQLSLYDVPNFQVGDACELPFDNESFDVVVAGEFLEHCPKDAALKALSEFSRVLNKNGHIVVTYPLDARPPEHQHAPHLLVTWKHGITSWHQSVWTDELLEPLLQELRLEELGVHRRDLDYSFCKGFGKTFRKL